MILETETMYALLILLTACLGPRQLSHARVFASLFSVEDDSLSDANHENPTVTLKGPCHVVSTTYHTPSSF